MSIYCAPWVIRVAEGITINKTDTNLCSRGAFKVMETDIKKIVIKFYCMLTCVIKRRKRKEGAGKRFAVFKGVMRDVREKVTFG